MSRAMQAAIMRTSLAPHGALRLALAGALLTAAVTHAPGVAGADDESALSPAGAVSPDVAGSSIASLALANVGKGACSTNTLGGTHFGSSCTGNGGSPEYWCADFALWVWASSGVADVAGLDAAAGSFYVYGQNHGTLKNTPSVGDAVVFDYAGGGVADHVAIVSKVNADGTIESVSGDWGGTGSTEAAFASTSFVVLNAPAYGSGVGTSSSVTGMTISGYVAPVGLGFAYGASFVGQSFPLASTALTMTAGETVHAYIELKNTGTKAWDATTKLGTTQPRDRASAFADGSWLAPNRLAAVSGTVAPGATYKFTFDLHAPSKPGTYLEYFNLVEEGVAWFSDPGQGGPADDDLEAKIVVVAAPKPPAVDAGASGGGAADGGGSPGESEDGGGSPVATDDAGAGANGATGPGAGGAPDGGGEGVANGATSDPPGASAGGCAVATRAAPGLDPGAILGLGALGLVARRRSRRANRAA